MARFIVPTTDSVTEILSMMYGEDLEVSESDGDCASDGRAAAYVCDDGQLVATCVCDPAFVVFSGSALTMVPPDAALGMVDERDFSEVVLANFHEVMNICSRLLMSNSSPHLRLDRILTTAAAEAALTTACADASTIGFSVNIPSYGCGQLLFKVS